MTHKMFILITGITCFVIYVATHQCISFYFRVNMSSLITENNSSRFFWTPGKSPAASGKMHSRPMSTKGWTAVIQTVASLYNSVQHLNPTHLPTLRLVVLIQTNNSITADTIKAIPGRNIG